MKIPKYSYIKEHHRFCWDQFLQKDVQLTVSLGSYCHSSRRQKILIICTISHLELIDELFHEEKVGAAEDKILKIMFFSVMISN